MSSRNNWNSQTAGYCELSIATTVHGEMLLSTKSSCRTLFFSDSHIFTKINAQPVICPFSFNLSMRTTIFFEMLVLRKKRNGRKLSILHLFRNALKLNREAWLWWTVLKLKWIRLLNVGPGVCTKEKGTCSTGKYAQISHIWTPNALDSHTAVQEFCRCTLSRWLLNPAAYRGISVTGSL